MIAPKTNGCLCRYQYANREKLTRKIHLNRD
ncbi:hypothetical protein Leryth_027373 [Lithospermum erythrorhizon]|nr:hypothetical protein Leryth_027373 [Lithospermum erythrorhizon]